MKFAKFPQQSGGVAGAITGSTALRPISYGVGRNSGPVFAPEDGGGSGGGASDDEDGEVEEKEDDLSADDVDESDKKKEDDADDKSGGDDDDDKKSKEDESLLKEVMKKKQALKDEKAKTADLEKKLKQFDGIDLDEVKQMLADKKAAADKKLEDKGDYEALKTQIVEAHEKELTAKDESIAELEASKKSLEGKIEELTIGHAFDSSNAIQEELVLTANKARIIYGDHFEYEDGAVVVYDKPRGAEGRTQFVDAKGEPVKFDEGLMKLVNGDPDKDALLKSKMKSGAGSDRKDAKKKSSDKSELRGLARINAGLADGSIELPKQPDAQ